MRSSNKIRKASRLLVNKAAALLIVAAVLSLATSTVSPQDGMAWSVDPPGSVVSNAVGCQWSPDIVSDGADGAIIVWIDGRGDMDDWDIYAQRVDSLGAKQWGTSGVAVCTAPGNQNIPSALSDGSGGAIILWPDYRDGQDAGSDIYAQRVNSEGTPLWGEDGTAICVAESVAAMVSDGCGGAFIVWNDAHNSDYESRGIYGQRVSSTGTLQWAENGLPISVGGLHPGGLCVVSDGSGGAVVAWMQYGDDGYDIYAQRIDPAGLPQWGDNGTALCAAPFGAGFVGAVSDGTGGTIIAWSEEGEPDDGKRDMYAQRVSHDGVTQWANDGISICTVTGGARSLSMVSDNANGAIFAWTDYYPPWYDFPPSPDSGVYVQRFDSEGTPQWGENGSGVYVAEGGDRGVNIAIDSAGGAIVAWADIDLAAWAQRVYAQRMSPDGTVQWAGGGVLVSSGSGPRLVADRSGGAIVTSCDGTVYAQRVNAWGGPGSPPNQPSNLSPLDGSTEISLNPTFEISVFSDADTGDRHWASQWQITTTAGDYACPVFDSGSDSLNLTHMALPAGILSDNATYYWHVRHRDSQGGWSEWSPETSFSALNHTPVQPAGIMPSDNASDVSPNPTFQSSAFSDPDSGDIHVASQWQIAPTAGGYRIPVFDSKKDSSHLTLLAVPTYLLSGNTTYYWQVRHQDNHGAWSEWSAETSFTTVNRPSKPSNISPADGAVETTTEPHFRCSGFYDADSGDIHAATQWRIASVPGVREGLVFDSGTDTLNLTSITLQPGILGDSETYYWQVRHQDKRGAWSEWSDETAFTTAVQDQTPGQPDAAANADGPPFWLWIAVGVGAVAVAASMTYLVRRTPGRR